MTSFRAWRRTRAVAAWPHGRSAVTTRSTERQAMTKRNPFAKDLPEMAQGLREQAASETAGSARPIPPEAAERPADGPEGYTGVIRPADEAEITLDSGWLCEVHQGCTCGTGGEHGQHEPGCGLVPIVKVADLLAENAELTAEVERYRSESCARIAVKTRLQADLDEARAEVERLRDEIENHMLADVLPALHAKDATIARLTARVDRFATLSSQDQDHAVKAISERNVALRTIADRDATIERVRALLGAGRWNPTSARADIRAALERDPNAASPVGSVHGVPTYTPMCRVHPEHFMPCSRCLGYGCPACDNAVQAADDRRSL